MPGRFIPLGELLEIRKDPKQFRELDEKQKEVLEAHQSAVKAFGAFKKTGGQITIGMMWTGARPRTTEEEHRAVLRAGVALRIALEYYNSHGKIEDAYTNLRGFAEAHWHPVISTLWGHHFTNRAADADIRLPEGLSSAKGEVIEDIFRMAVTREIAGEDPAERRKQVDRAGLSHALEQQTDLREKPGTRTEHSKPFRKLPSGRN